MADAQRLHPIWHKWRRTRRHELLRDGVSRELANLVANREARARNRIARLHGHEAAKNANLLFMKQPSGELRVFAIGNLTDILTALQRERAEEITREILVDLNGHEDDDGKRFT